MAVTDKLERGDLDTKAASGDTSEKMIATVYDLRPQRVVTGEKRWLNGAGIPSLISNFEKPQKKDPLISRRAFLSR